MSCLISKYLRPSNKCDKSILQKTIAYIAVYFYHYQPHSSRYTYAFQNYQIYRKKCGKNIKSGNRYGRPHYKKIPAKWKSRTEGSVKHVSCCQGVNNPSTLNFFVVIFLNIFCESFTDLPLFNV